ncbi:MAG: nucleotide exchange factor GrpE [Pseudomonadota bacterium]
MSDKDEQSKEDVSLGEVPEAPMVEDEELIDILSADAAMPPEEGEEEAEPEGDLAEENAQLKDRLMRALADAENQRKRGERDRRDAEIYGGRKLARDLLPVYDNMERALAAATDEQREANKSLFEGIELTQRELVSVFAKHQIVAIAPQAGDKFDPEIHQAMFEAPMAGTKKGDIIQVMEVGFMIAHRLLRPANVGVSAGDVN